MTAYPTPLTPAEATRTARAALGAAGRGDVRRGCSEPRDAALAVQVNR